jgi:hypothetical protein
MSFQIDIILRYLKIFSFIIFSTFTGYAIQDLDKDFLNQFTKIHWQFIITLALSASFFNFKIIHWKQNISEIIIVSILATATLQYLKYKYPSNKIEETTK